MSSYVHVHVHTNTHTLTLFTLPRYSSPSLHRAKTSSPSLTPPILKESEREQESDEREQERMREMERRQARESKKHIDTEQGKD